MELILRVRLNPKDVDKMLAYAEEENLEEEYVEPSEISLDEE